MIEVNYTLGIQLVNFLIMLWFLNAFVFKPVLRFVEEREKKMKAMDHEAKGAAERCDAALSGYESKLKKMRQDASEITSSARREAQDASLKIVEDARVKFKAELDGTRDNIKKDMDDASASLKKEVSGMASLIASRILGRNV